MNGFPYEGGCALDGAGATGKIDSLEHVYTGMNHFGQACGFDVTYTWMGIDSLTFTIHTN